MEWLDLIYFLLLGGATGILSGLFGFGGGVFVVPSLFLIFQFIDFPKDIIMQLAVGTSLATLIFTALVSTWSHHRKKAVHWNITRKWTLSIILGSILGVIIARFLPSEALARIFGYFMLALSIYLLIPSKKPFFHKPTSFWPTSLFGGSIGLLSSLLGIGGGTVAVPVFVSMHMPLKNAIATSSSLTILTGIIGSIGYLLIGWNMDLPESFGFIYLPAFITMSIMTVVTAPIGVKLAHLLSTKLLKILCGTVLALISFAMILS